MWWSQLKPRSSLMRSLKMLFQEIKTEYLNSEELEDPAKVLEIMDHKSTLKDEVCVMGTIG